MPRIGATLAALVLIACSIAVNVSRYPVVWEMATPVAQSSPAGQTAQSEPAANADEPSSSPGSFETGSASEPYEAYATSDGYDSASSLAGEERSRCAEGVCSLGPAASGEPSDTSRGEYTYEDPYPAVDRAASADERERGYSPEPGPDPDENPTRYEGFAQHYGPTPYGADTSSYDADTPSYGADTSSSYGDDTSSYGTDSPSYSADTSPYGSDTSSYGADSSPYGADTASSPAWDHDDSASTYDNYSDSDEPYGYSAGSTEQHDYSTGRDEQYDYSAGGTEPYDYSADSDEQYEQPLSGGAEQVEPSGPYAGSGRPGDSSRPGEVSLGEGRRTGAAWPGAQAARPVVPVVPQRSGWAQGPVVSRDSEVRQSDADVAPQYGPGPSSPGASSTGLSREIRRLPPVDELNPFLNDGYDPPVPDVSGMNYPSTGMPRRSS